MRFPKWSKPILGISIILVLALSPLVQAAFSDDPARIGEVVKSYLQLMEQRSAKPPDMAKIKASYGALAPLFAEADTVMPGLKADADNYLAQAEKATAKTPPLQGVEKSAQRAFVVLLRRSLSKVKSQGGDVEAALATLKAARALYGGIENTALRRGDYIGSQRIFQDRMLYALDFIETAVKAKNAKNIEAGMAEANGVVDRVYFLSVLYELDGIAANRGKDEVVVAEKQIEGILFFKIIKDSAKNAQAAALIEAQFAKPAADINLQLIKDNLKIAYPELAEEFKSKM